MYNHVIWPQPDEPIDGRRSRRCDGAAEMANRKRWS
jgi:hypothetical protein